MGGLGDLPLAMMLHLWLPDQLIQISVLVLLALSLNLINGWGRMFSLGHHGFYFLGAYGAAWMTAELDPGLPGVLVLLVSVLFGTALAALGGLAIGVPCLRLRGDYLAIATLGFGEGVRQVVTALDSRVPPGMGVRHVLFELSPSTQLTYRLIYLGVLVGVVVLVALGIRNFIRSSKGRVMLAVAQDEVAAGLLGLPPARSRVFVFVVGSGIAGLAGALFAHYSGSVATKDFEFVRMVYIFLVVVLGGLGSLSGCIVAAVVFYATERALIMRGGIIGQWSQVIFALLLILMMIFRPKGIFGPRELTDIVREWKAKRRARTEGGAA
ncbi:MAG: branched-chain amino acid ABC transporter permease [Planctomycetota bacterium]